MAFGSGVVGQSTSTTWDLATPKCHIMKGVGVMQVVEGVPAGGQGTYGCLFCSWERKGSTACGSDRVGQV